MFKRKRKLTRIFPVLFFLSLFASVQVFAALDIKEISGTFGHGLSVTIIGNGFGGKPINPNTGDHSPLRFDDFENGKIGDYVEAGGWWRREYDFVDCKYNNMASIPAGRAVSTRHAFSDKHIRWHSIGWPEIQGNFYKDNVGFALTGKAYVNLWVYIDYVSGVGEIGGQWQNKLIWLHSTHNHSSRPNVHGFTWTGDSVHTSQYYYTINCATNHYRIDIPGPTEGYWANIAIQHKESDANIANGAIHLYTSRTPLSNGSYHYGSKESMVTRNNLKINTISLGYFMSNGGKEINTYWDDIYIDNSWARIEIGDTYIYDNCTHREIQYPSAWSDISIQVKLNQGSFGAGDGVYLFVVDENGTASQGYGPMNFGSGPGFGLPSIPANFLLQ